MVSKIKTAILPVAGLGTRLLPLTKAVPKELLPIYDTPLLQFAIQEAQDAGIERLIFVSHPSKKIIERQVKPDGVLMSKLRRRGKDDLADVVLQSEVHADVEAHFVYQERQLGLGHAVLCARELALDRPFAVILPDDLIVGTGCLAEMVAAYDPVRAGLMVAAMEVSKEDIHKYGAFNSTGRDGKRLPSSGLVEKPAPHDAPSLFGAVGRYILPHNIFDELARTKPGSGGEIQLTDAIAAMTPDVGLEGFIFDGRRFDCGHHDGLLEASNWRKHEVECQGKVAPMEARLAGE
ncbi:sugar phosphate nucleotidyltransferase [Loktanella sp. SALINAS62]|uniref:UTP--glucose-1-phosphate uridylyltransferase n=1 Tax=Loktanella sp. SALINAS62 TaxID=2706124 RepID=UPI001B8D022D|nr:sugar phosphate nucleotidyltransferase [Loktanella sp. SALINAS62]MBS1302173.1 NTP transferase domain-containing protein [Loktanella sp. SALINAS62]